MGRISRDQLLMEVAMLYAQRSVCARLKVGAVLSLEGRIIAAGYNGTLPNQKECSSELCDFNKPCDKTIHAETNLLLFCAQQGIKTLGADLYITHSPCVNCSRNIVQAGIKNVNYNIEYRDKEPIKLLENNGVLVKQIVI